MEEPGRDGPRDDLVLRSISGGVYAGWSQGVIRGAEGGAGDWRGG